MIRSQILGVPKSHLCRYCRRILLRSRSSFAGSELRQRFLDFHDRKGYTIGRSSSLVPDDLSLLFVNSGMVPLKKYFLKPPKSEEDSRSLANCQKCIRAGGKHNDFSEIGSSPHHLTFFEMLGSWSFNSYFTPQQICTHALELLTQDYGIDQNDLSVTYFGGDVDKELPPDDRCAQIWRDLGFKQEQIIAKDIKDNFWTMGSGGPCGPCTEIHFREKHSQQLVELWNIVFIRYNMLSYGVLKPLGREHIDTGMGLERLTALLQTGSSCVFDSDLFRPILHKIAELCGRPDIADNNYENVDARIVADHSRAITAAVADGVTPGSNGAAYVVRKLIRHAAYRGSVLAHQDMNKATGILPELCKVVATSFEDVYPEIKIEANNVVDTVYFEEKRFMTSLESGNKKWKEMIEKKQPTSEDLFFFYSVQGFPREVIDDLCRRDEIQFSSEDFDKQLEHHVQKSRAKSQSEISKRLFNIAADNLRAEGVPETDESRKYTMTRSPNGMYQLPMINAKVVALVLDEGQLTSAVPVMRTCYVVLDKSPFYAQAGGQISDTGRIRRGDSVFQMEGDAPVQVCGGYVFHKGNIALGGSFSVGDEVSALVDVHRRVGCMQHHTATHLLTAALEMVLNRSVKQRSSLITNNFARFGFWTVTPIKVHKLCGTLEMLINGWIDEGCAVKTELIARDKMTTTKSLRYMMAEGYPDPLIAIRIAPQSGDLISLEACGGTHVKTLEDLQKFRIIDWKSKGSGEVSVTVVVGQAALDATKRGNMLLLKLRDFPDTVLNEENLNSVPLVDKIEARQMIKQ